VADFLPPTQSPLETTLQLATTYAFQAGTIELPLGTVFGSTHIHPTCLARLVQPVGGRSMTRGPINQEVGTPPPLGFLHTMLNVKRVKDNMRLAFIEKLFTNREIGTIMQTRYFCFKGMSYENERYLCDINCVQLRKALARFRCGNTQLEAVLGAWKGVPYAERLCRGCDLGKVEDEEHLFLSCPNTQKVRERFCSTLPLIHTSILAELMQTTNTITLAKFVACCSTRGQSVLHDLPFV
jgi:hypothetical protein